MPGLEQQRNRPRKRLSRDLAIAGVVISALGIVLAQPAVMSLAGLDFGRQRRIGAVDPLAVGSIVREQNVHGLTGVLKPLRLRD